MFIIHKNETLWMQTGLLLFILFLLLYCEKLHV